MSIYFFHVIQSFFGITLWLSLFNKKISLKEFSISCIVGFAFAFGIFTIANEYIFVDNLKIFADCMATVFLLFFWFVFFVKYTIPKIAVISSLIFSYTIFYFVFSHNFPLFSGELLDTMSIISFGFVILGFLIICLLYIFLREINSNLNKFVLVFLAIFVTIFLIIKIFGDVSTELMRYGIIDTYGFLLSIVAKIKFYGLIFPYFYMFIIGLILVLYFSTSPKLEKKEVVGSIIFRKIKASRNRIFLSICFVFILIFTTTGLMLYYDLHASKPPTISTPTILEPIDGKFIIPIETLRDNNLHRYAYITDAGNKIRFFLLNRFPDKDSPTAVFDSCMICGDMGYVKKGNELICIACNVRIFLPSVGKEGGCNPIPFPFEFDGKNVVIELSIIEKGVNYFHEIVEKKVQDPVSKKMITNIKAPKDYVFGGKTYFFESDDTYNAFRQDPEKYVGNITEAFWKAKGYQALGSEL